MAFRSGNSTMMFEVSSSIPQIDTAGDSRYTRSFIAKEPITIRKPSNLSNLYENQEGDVYPGFAKPYDEFVDGKTWSELYYGATGVTDAFSVNVPQELYSAHTKAMYFVFDSYGRPTLTADPDHYCMGLTGTYGDKIEISFKQNIMRNRAAPVGAPSNEANKTTMWDSQVGITGSDISTKTAIPYLWGSIVEGLQSGARRFLVGPTLNYSEMNSSNYSESFQAQNPTYDSLSKNSGLRFIMPSMGSDMIKNSTRYDLFNYAGSKTPVSINEEFFANTPFSSKRIDYSGIKMAPRKGLPSGYMSHDLYTSEKALNLNLFEEPGRMKDGWDALPADVKGSIAASYSSGEAQTRNKAYAITKRHALTFNWKMQAIAGDGDNTGVPYDSWCHSVTGTTAPIMTDMDEAYSKGDKVWFWDKNRNTVVERTIVDILPINVNQFHKTLGQMYGVALKSRLNSTWTTSCDPSGSFCFSTMDDVGHGSYQFWNPLFSRLFDCQSNAPVGGSGQCSVSDFNARSEPATLVYAGISGDNVRSFSQFKRHLFETDSLKFGTDAFAFDVPSGVTLPTTTTSIGFGRNQDNFTTIQYPNIIGLTASGVGATSGTQSTNPLLVYSKYQDYMMKFLEPSLDRSRVYGNLLNQNLPLPSTYNINMESEEAKQFLSDVAFEDNSAKLNFAYKPAFRSQGDTLGSKMLETEDNRTVFGSEPTDSGIGEDNSSEPDSNEPRLPPKENDPTVPNLPLEQAMGVPDTLPQAMANAIKEFFPYGLNDIFYGSLNLPTISEAVDFVSSTQVPTNKMKDLDRTQVTWNYLLGHYKGLLSSNAAIMLLDADLPDGVKPIAFKDSRRSKEHKYEIFLDHANEGFLFYNCPTNIGFFPSFYCGGGGPLCNYGYPKDPEVGGYRHSVGSYTRLLANPYDSSSMLLLGMRRVGKCTDTEWNIKDDCQEEPGKTEGPNCKWDLFEVTPGTNGIVDFSSPYSINTKVATVPSDTFKTNPCFYCEGWESRDDPRAVKLPSNTTDQDKLLFFQGPSSRLLTPTSELPAPVFTYNEKGVPIISRVILGSRLVSGYNYANPDVVFEYTVTGHHGEDFLPGDIFIQNLDGTTGPGETNPNCSDDGASAAVVLEYSREKGRLTLVSWLTYTMVYSTDFLKNCATATNPQLGGYMRTSGTNNPCIAPSWGHAMGVTGYGFTNNLKIDKQDYPNGKIKWCTLLKGGPLVVGYPSPYSFLEGYWWQGGAAAGDGTLGYNNRCEQSFGEGWYHPERRNANPGEHSILNYGSLDIGKFLSDQKVYLRNMQNNPDRNYMYMGKVCDIFYKMLDTLNARNGVEGQYRCRTEIIKFDDQSTDFEQPMAYFEKPVEGKFEARNVAPGVYTNENEFLK